MPPGVKGLILAHRFEVWVLYFQTLDIVSQHRGPNGKQPVPVNLGESVAECGGAISGQRALRGVILPFADLLIGATALHHGCEVVTENIRHFEMIPDLVVRKLQLAFFCCAIKFPADDFLRAVIICGRSR